MSLQSSFVVQTSNEISVSNETLRFFVIYMNIYSNLSEVPIEYIVIINNM